MFKWSVKLFCIDMEGGGHVCLAWDTNSYQFQQIKLSSGVSSRGRIKLTRQRRTRYQQFRSSSVVIFKFVWHLHFAFKCLRFDISQRETRGQKWKDTETQSFVHIWHCFILYMRLCFVNGINLKCLKIYIFLKGLLARQNRQNGPNKQASWNP